LLENQQKQVRTVRVCLVLPPTSIPQHERITAIMSLLAVAAVLEEAGFTVELVDPSLAKTAHTGAHESAWRAPWGGTA
jgi:hypothetical protein